MCTLKGRGTSSWELVRLTPLLNQAKKMLQVRHTGQHTRRSKGLFLKDDSEHRRMHVVAVKPPTASGATPVPTPAVPLPGCCPSRRPLCLRFRRNTRCVLRLRLPSTGTAPLEQAGFVVKLLPKLAFFTLWDRLPRPALPDLLQAMTY